MKSITRRKKSLRKKKSIRRKKSPVRRKSIRRSNKFKYDRVIIDELTVKKNKSVKRTKSNKKLFDGGKKRKRDEDESNKSFLSGRELQTVVSFSTKDDIDNLRQVNVATENDIIIKFKQPCKEISLNYINNTDFKDDFDDFLARKKITNFHLKLDNCSLEKFPYFELPNEKIVVLNLTNNYIKNIPDDIGIKLPKLRILDLSYCELETFPNFEPPLTELIELDLSLNPDITTIPDIGILPKLQILNLSFCKNFNNSYI